MKYILSFAMMIALLSCNAQQKENTSGTEQSVQQSLYSDVSNEEAKVLINGRPDLQIIDVRTDGEVAQGIIDGAVQIDISKPSFERELTELDKNAPVLVYCRSGGRSKTAQNRMKDMGFKEVHNLRNGYSQWK